MGYAAHAVCHVTTYEYRAPRGLNHGLAVLHEEMSHYLVPPMLEDAAALLGDFIVTSLRTHGRQLGMQPLSETKRMRA